MIGIEANSALRSHSGGMGRYTRELLMALQRIGHANQVIALYPIRRALLAFNHIPGVHNQWYWRNRHLERYRIIHVTNQRFTNRKSGIEVATAHDFYPLRPEARPFSTELLTRKTAFARRADHVICVSETTRRHMHELTDIPESCSTTIPLGVNPKFTPPSASTINELRTSLRIPRDFLVFLGHPRDNKNLDRMLEAYSGSAIDIPIMLTGHLSPRERSFVKERARHFRIDKRLILTGFIPEKQLPALLGSSNGVLLPSTFEGFGLPVLEGMACGAPVLTSINTACSEVAGEHGIKVDPWCIDSICDGIKRLMHVTESETKAAMEHAAKFTWERTAHDTMKVYESLL